MTEYPTLKNCLQRQDVAPPLPLPGEEPATRVPLAIALAAWFAATGLLMTGAVLLAAVW